MKEEAIMAKKIIDKLEKVLDIMDSKSFRVYDCGDNTYEVEFYSDAGEDFVFTLSTDGTAEGFAKELRSYADDFEPDEHAGEMYEAGKNGLSGVPNLSVLIRDAESIGEYLSDVANAVTDALAKA